MVALFADRLPTTTSTHMRDLSTVKIRHSALHKESHISHSHVQNVHCRQISAIFSAAAPLSDLFASNLIGGKTHEMI